MRLGERACRHAARGDSRTARFPGSSNGRRVAISSIGSPCGVRERTRRKKRARSSTSVEVQAAPGTGARRCSARTSCALLRGLVEEASPSARCALELAAASGGSRRVRRARLDPAHAALRARRRSGPGSAYGMPQQRMIFGVLVEARPASGTPARDRDRARSPSGKRPPVGQRVLALELEHAREQGSRAGRSARPRAAPR